MKIIIVDNFNRESQPDILIAENVNKQYIDEMINALNNKHSSAESGFWCTKVNDDYKLSKDMEDLV